MTFTKFKDRIWGVYGAFGGGAARLPRPLGRAAFSIVDAALWIGWALPRSPLRRTARALARQSGAGSATALYGHFVSGFVAALHDMERLRAGHAAEIDARVQVPEAGRLDAMLTRGGVLMVMPHANGALHVVRGLAQRHTVTLLARATRNDARARAQRAYYDRLGATVIDVRRTPETRVARHVLRALRGGEIVIGAGDLIGAPPEVAHDTAHDRVRVTAFGQPIGAAGWPHRFAARAGVPILPVMIAREGPSVVLHLGPAVGADDAVTATQAWMDGLIRGVLAHPADWAFVFDRHWMRVLAAADAAPAAPAPAPSDRAEPV